MPSTVALTVAYSLSATISVLAALAIFRRREVRGGRCDAKLYGYLTEPVPE